MENKWCSVFLLLFTIINILNLTNGYDDEVSFADYVKKYCKLAQCQQQMIAHENEYEKYFDLSEIKGSKPEGYIARFTVYLKGTRDAHILLAETDKPDFDNDYLYEFMIGGYGNSRTLVRKKKYSDVLSEKNTYGIVSDKIIREFIIEISEGGYIKLFSGSKEPVLTAIDLKPVHVKYVGFASWDSSKVEYFFDCQNETNSSSEETDTVHKPHQSQPKNGAVTTQIVYIFLITTVFVQMNVFL